MVSNNKIPHYYIMAKTKTKSRKPRTTKRCNPEQTKHSIVTTFLEMLNTVKVYHWNTRSFAEHKATDELYAKLNEGVDQFVETLLGKRGDRLSHIHKKSPILTLSKTDFKSRMFEYRDYLVHMDKCLARESDLLSLRDEILANVNQFLYLMTFH